MARMAKRLCSHGHADWRYCTLCLQAEHDELHPEPPLFTQAVANPGAIPTTIFPVSPIPSRYDDARAEVSREGRGVGATMSCEDEDTLARWHFVIGRVLHNLDNENLANSHTGILLRELVNGNPDIGAGMVRSRNRQKRRADDLEARLQFLVDQRPRHLCEVEGGERGVIFPDGYFVAQTEQI